MSLVSSVGASARIGGEVTMFEILGRSTSLGVLNLFLLSPLTWCQSKDSREKAIPYGSFAQMDNLRLMSQT